MAAWQTTLTIQTRGQGLHPISDLIQGALRDSPHDGSATGVLHLFLQHTSASLVIQENADPTAKHDLEEFMNRLVPEDEPWHRHLDEGPDDTVSHMKAAVLPTSLTLPVREGILLVGSWQGVYLWEHRRRPHTRRLVLTLLT